MRVLKRSIAGAARVDTRPARVPARDIFAEALAGVAQRPARAVLTAVGTVLGVGSFVAVLGVAATTNGQISARFDALLATEVVVEDSANVDLGEPPNSFPADSDARISRIDGVRSGGVWWTVKAQRPLAVSAVPTTRQANGPEVEVMATSAGLLPALKPDVSEGRLYDSFHDRTSQQVAVLGSAAATQLGIMNLSVQPAIFIGEIPFTVIGIIRDVHRRPEVLQKVLVPRHTAEKIWGQPGVEARPSMLIDTTVGAAQVVAQQTAVALRPDAPELMNVLPPPEPSALRQDVATDLSTLLLVLASVSLVIGAVGIANTTMVAVLERVSEIGLRRALGARRRHIAAQFLTESALLGTLGGAVGTAIGVLVVLVTAIARQWTPLIDPSIALPAPLAGTVVGILAGLYPALRAANIEPVEALRR